MASSSILLITGANSGLGLQTVKALCQSSRSYTILLGGRDLSKAGNAAKEVQAEFPKSKSVIRTVQIDIEDDSSIENLYSHVASKYGRLDVLINNAGGQFDQQFAAGKMTMRDLWNKSWAVNTTSTQIVTYTFLPLLLKSQDPRLVFITSGTSTLTESDNTAVFVNRPPPRGWPKDSLAVAAYRSSKTGMNMMMREWARILHEDGVKLWCISPGHLATALGGDQQANKNAGAIDPSIGANFVKDVVEGARDGDVGKAIRKDDVQPW